jgi:hypothetical protein
LFVDHFLVGMRTFPYGILAAFDPVSPTSDGNFTKPTIYLNCHVFTQALTNAVREMLGKNKSRSGVSTKAPIEFAENPQLVPETATTTIGAESQSGSNMDLGERILQNVVGENVNEDGQRGVVGVEKTRQDLEDLECNLEFLLIERQI